MATPSQETAAEAGQRFAAAHDAMLRDRSIQFELKAADPPPRPPAWIQDVYEWLAWALRPIGRAIAWIHSLLPDAPYARMLFWGVIAAAGCLILWRIVDRVRHGRWWQHRRRAAAASEPQAEDWTPEAAPARAWLREADALAAEGRYGEAVHHLLLRSIEDIARRRPRLVRPALTSRDIARTDAIPAVARTIFADIAAIVERSLFGGRAVGDADWSQARAAYADFALAGTWS